MFKYKGDNNLSNIIKERRWIISDKLHHLKQTILLKNVYHYYNNYTNCIIIYLINL